MSLLGWPLLVTLGLFAVGLPVATYVVWSRLRGPRAVRAGARLAMIGLSQVAAVLLVAAAINNYGYFYGSWSELFGSSSTNARIQAVTVAPSFGGGGKFAKVVGRGVGGRVNRLPMTDWSTPGQWASKGRVDSVYVQGFRSGEVNHAFVYLPPQYFQPAYARMRFPAAEVLSGYPVSDLSLLNRPDFPHTLLRDMAQHQARPMILVMMSPTLEPPRDTECTNVPGGPQVETFFGQDVPAAFGQSTLYRVRAGGWGAIGDSVGGYCAAKLTLMQPHTFTAGVALSGYFMTLQDNTTGDLWGGSQALRNENNLEWRLTHLPVPAVSLLVAESRQERGIDGWRDTRRFLSLVRPPLKVDTLLLDHGAHSMQTFATELPPALGWLSAHLGPPAPPPKAQLVSRRRPAVAARPATPRQTPRRG